MTHTLSKAQIDAIKVELRKYGLNVLPMPGKRGKVAPHSREAKAIDARIARVMAMKFKTAGVKTSILRTLKSLKAGLEWQASHPGSITDLLAMFGVRLGDVQPWSGERWECLANGLPTGRLALPAPAGTRYPDTCGKMIYADAAAPVRRIVCKMTAKGALGH